MLHRASSTGVVFQSYNLLLNASAVENVVLSMNLSADGSQNCNLDNLGNATGSKQDRNVDNRTDRIKIMNRMGAS